MNIDLDLNERSVITTLLRREALRLRAAGHAEATTEAATLLRYVDKIELWPEEIKPSRIDKTRDLEV